MNWIVKSITALTVGLILTSMAAVGSFIVVMLSTQPGEGRRDAFFGALYVEGVAFDDGGVGLEMGLASALPLIVFFLVSVLAVLAVFLLHGWLVRYRAALVAEGDTATV